MFPGEYGGVLNRVGDSSQKDKWWWKERKREMELSISGMWLFLVAGTFLPCQSDKRQSVTRPKVVRGQAAVGGRGRAGGVSSSFASMFSENIGEGRGLKEKGGEKGKGEPIQKVKPLEIA